jgi:hypothetical protein
MLLIAFQLLAMLVARSTLRSATYGTRILGTRGFVVIDEQVFLVDRVCKDRDLGTFAAIKDSK